MNKEGILYLVATPIGNLEDITLRAINTLKKVDSVICENKNRALKLLNYLDIKKRLIGYHDYNKLRATRYIINLLKQTNTLALISDAGTPGIQDPGFYLIREVIKNNIKVEPIPGAVAFIPALIASGLPTDRFLFLGFLTKRSARRKKELSKYKDIAATIIIYIPMKKVYDILKDIYEVYGDRKVVLARELTKIHEEFIRGSVKELISSIITEKGEGVLIIDKE